jgi:acetyl esterase/lipase
LKEDKPAFNLIVEQLLIPGPFGNLPARLYKPESKRRQGGALPLVLYFHGGGFVRGTVDDAETPSRFIAANCPAAVLAVGYSLAPVRPFPAAPEDVYAAANWAVKHARSFDADPDRLAVVGDDAGGNLAASLTLIARDRNEIAIAAQAMVGPMLDPSMTHLGDPGRLRSDVSPQECAACYRQYLPTALQRLHPYAAPLESSRLGGLPPAFIATAQCDVLHKEAEKYAAALIGAGVHTQVARYADLNHRDLRDFAPVLQDLTEFLRRKLTPQARKASLPT